MTTTPPNRQQRATDHPARLAAGPHRAAQRAGARRNRPNRARRALSGPVMALGSSAADLTSPSAKLAQTVKASPTGPSAAGRAAVALTGRAGVANHATNPALPSIHYPMTTPGTGCELHAQISEKDSDTRQARAYAGVPGRVRLPIQPPTLTGERNALLPTARTGRPSRAAHLPLARRRARLRTPGPAAATARQAHPSRLPRRRSRRPPVAQGRSVARPTATALRWRTLYLQCCTLSTSRR